MDSSTRRLPQLGEAPRRAALLGAKLAAVLGVTLLLATLGLWDAIDLRPP